MRRSSLQRIALYNWHPLAPLLTLTIGTTSLQNRMGRTKRFRMGKSSRAEQAKSKARNAALREESELHGGTTCLHTPIPPRRLESHGEHADCMMLESRSP